jgi:subtilase family serine protease
MLRHWTPRRLPVLPRATIAAGLLAATLGAAAPAFAADKPDLTLAISPSASSIPLGNTVDLTYTMSNLGATAVGSARMEGAVSGAQSLKITAQPAGQPNSCTLSGTALTCPGLVLGAGDSASVRVQATASSSTTGTISARGTMDPKLKVDESKESNNSAVRNVTVFRKPDLTTTILDGPHLVKGGAHVTFKVQVKNLGGSTNNIGLDLRTTNGLVYDSVAFDGDTHGFTCNIHNPATGANYVSCSNGTLGDPSVSPAGDESATLLIGAKVKDRGLTSKYRTFSATVDPDNLISESSGSNNVDTWDFQYD